MDVSSLVVGAGIALGSAFLGVISESVKGWLIRRHGIYDKRSAFRHRTASELQDLLLELVTSTGEIRGFAQGLSKATGVWSFETVPLEMGRSHRTLIMKIGALHERLDDSETRDQVNEVLNIATESVTAKTEDESTKAHDHLMKIAFPVNASLGKVIRESHPTQ